jgi:hypothetical protein
LYLYKKNLIVIIDTFIARKVFIKFSKIKAIVSIKIRKINFKVLKVPILFLLYFIDINRLKVYFNNTIDKLI